MIPHISNEPVCLQEKGRNFIDMLGRAHVLDLLYFMLTTEKPVRFNEIKRQIGITATTLSKRLEELQAQNLVDREVFPEVPARVEYSLSREGKTLAPVLESIFSWVEKRN